MIKNKSWKLVLCLLSFSIILGCISTKNNGNDWTYFFKPCEEGEATKLESLIYPIKQRKSNDCWFATYGTLLSWKEQRKISYEELLDSIGSPWKEIVTKNKGIDFPKQKEFFAEKGLGFYGPANYTYEAYVNMLKKHGPLWINMGSYKKFLNHARVLIEVDCGASKKETMFHLYDPAKGKVEKWDAYKFFTHFEQEAKELVEADMTHIEWRYQIIYKE